MSSYWGWLEAYEHEALADGNRDKLYLCLYHAEAFHLRETDPDQALHIYQSGRQLANSMGEKWWALYYAHWCAQALMHFKRDYRDVLELTVANALEARKPVYDEFPQRIAVYQDLVAAYEGIDPEGHFEKIHESFDAIERCLTLQLETRRHALESHKRDVALQLGDYATALAAGIRGLSLIDHESNLSTASHYSVFVYAGLSEIAYRMGNWERLQEWARLGEERARIVGHRMELSELLIWQAVALRHLGIDDEARRLTATAVAPIRRLSMPPTSSFFSALVAYHEEGGDYDKALQVREWELNEAAGWGRTFYECRLRLERCRLLAKLGHSLGEEADAVRETTARLIKPERHLAELERILSGKA